MIIRELSLIKVMSFKVTEKLVLNFKIVLIIEYLTIKLLTI